jgi:hypothetical protein
MHVEQTQICDSPQKLREPQCTRAVYLCFHGAYTFMKFNTLLALAHREKQEHPMTRDISHAQHDAFENKYLINYTRAPMFYKSGGERDLQRGIHHFQPIEAIILQHFAPLAKKDVCGIGISIRSN